MRRWAPSWLTTSGAPWRTPISTADVDDILKLVQQYYDGMVFGRVELLERVFDPAARFQGVRDGAQVRRGLPEFVAMVAAPAGSSPAMADYSVNVELVDITGPIALVKVKDRFRGRTYVDYLTLVKGDGEWRIVNKAFTTVEDARQARE